MHDLILSCCSTVDLTKEHLESRNIHYLCYHYFLDGVEHVDDLGETISYPDFYQAMADGAETKTTQLNISQYLDYFIPFLEEGKDILHVTLSSGLSGSYTSAANAAAIAQERYPDQKIYVVDSLGASSGTGLIMETLADMRDAGTGIDELYAWIMANRLRMHHWFYSTDLTFYVKGGRISKAAGVFGGLLNICPLLYVDHEGHLIPKEKIRTKKKAMEAVVKKMEQDADNGLDYDGKCYICNSNCREDGEELKAMVKARFPKINGDIIVNDIGTTIGSHTGTGTVAVFFWGKERVD